MGVAWNNTEQEGASFELMFPWNGQWMSMSVVPVNDGLSFQYFVIKMQGLVLVLHLNVEGEWEELKEGSSELARHLGEAIESYYAFCA